MKEAGYLYLGRNFILEFFYCWDIITCLLAGFPNAMNAITAAMDEWITKTCIRFKERTDEGSYVTFINGNE